MGERKVLNKYYPPDFDPSKIPRRRQPKNQQIKVRMMLPMSIRCNTCGNYIYKGTKFNSRKEDVIAETYLGIQIFRFYFKCTKCSSEITMKTDPQNTDYVVEAGATRNFEPWRSTDEAIDDAKKKRDAEEMGDAMKALENRTIDSKREMDILAALDEMKSMRARHAGVDTEQMLEALRHTAELKEKELAEEDEAMIRSMVFQSSGDYVRRLNDNEVEDDDNSDGDNGQRKKQKAEDVNGGQISRDENKNVLATSVLVEGSVDNAVPQSQASGAAVHGPKASFAVRPKTVAFNVKPKKVEPVMELTQSLQETAAPITAGCSLSTANQILENGSDKPAGTGLASLCATYDSESSD